MAIEIETIQTKIKNKNKRKKCIVGFEEEVIDKNRAAEVLSKVQEENFLNSESVPKKKQKVKQLIKSEDNVHVQKLHKVVKQKSNKLNMDSAEAAKNFLKRKEHAENEDTNEMPQNMELSGKERKKKKIKVEEQEVNESSENEVNNEASSENNSDTQESKRLKKKKKHVELMEAKKLKATLVTQENVLNYLSKWKHSPSEWKFEKLKQIWLSNNLFDSSKIPDEFWETAVDYFSNSKGFIRKLILREALKIIDEDKLTEEQPDTEFHNKIKRARNIVQILQE